MSVDTLQVGDQGAAPQRRRSMLRPAERRNRCCRAKTRVVVARHRMKGGVPKKKEGDKNSLVGSRNLGKQSAK